MSLPWKVGLWTCISTLLPIFWVLFLGGGEDVGRGMPPQAMHKIHSLHRVNTYKFLNSGIPFAAAPVKNLRFMPPVTVSPWKEVLDTNQFQPVCPQVNQFQLVCPQKTQIQLVCPQVNHFQPVFPQVNQFQPFFPQDNQFQPVFPQVNQVHPVCPQVNQFQPVCPKVNHFQPVCSLVNQFQPVWPR